MSATVRGDPAAGRHDLHVGRAADAHLELGRAVPGPRQVRVRIDEAGDDRAAARVERVARLECRPQVAAAADGCNPPVRDGDRAILDDAELAHRRAAARPAGAALRAGQRRQLADVVDEKVSLHVSASRESLPRLLPQP